MGVHHQFFTIPYGLSGTYRPQERHHCIYFAGVIVLELNIMPSERPRVGQRLNLTPLQRFTDLEQLWIQGHNEQRLIIEYRPLPNVTSLPIKHMHLNMRLIAEKDSHYGNQAFRFMTYLKQLKTFDISDVFYPRTDFKRMLSSIGNHDSLEIISLRRLQAKTYGYLTDAMLNVTSFFPAYFSKSVTYLDLSHNEFEAISGKFHKQLH